MFAELERVKAERQQLEQLLQHGTSQPGRLLELQMGEADLRVRAQRYVELVLVVATAATPATPVRIRQLVSEVDLPQLRSGLDVELRCHPQDPAQAVVSAVRSPHAPGGVHPIAQVGLYHALLTERRIRLRGDIPIGDRKLTIIGVVAGVLFVALIALAISSAVLTQM